MNFQESVTTCLKKYVTFDGRSGRAEFWWFALFQLLAMAAARVLGETVYALVGLGLLLPGLAVGARRLHDVGKSAWFLLLWFVPVIGWGILIYWGAQPSAVSNQHGEPAEAAPPPGEALPPGAV